VLVEYVRNVMGIGANHAEVTPDADELVVTALSCSLVGETHEVLLQPGSRAAELYGIERAEEDYFCSYGLNPAYRPTIEAAGMSVTGWDAEGDVRIVELTSHPFFVATLFCFQTRSRPEAPHPLVRGLVAAAQAVSRPALG
jgi:CTP synthase (UTP-ammonia lyase)